jgi:hypothetical protein
MSEEEKQNQDSGKTRQTRLDEQDDSKMWDQIQRAKAAAAEAQRKAAEEKKK